jgi:protein-S-isoprenylcysteine O-methyltransferase Ste14
MLAHSDLQFRLLIAISLILGWAIRFQMVRKTKNAAIVKSVETKRENLLLKIGNFAFGLPLIYVVSTLLDFAHLDLPKAARWLGVIILFTGNGVFYAAHSALGRNWSGTLDIRENHTLITRGIYQYIRHPMYLGFFLLAIGIFLSSANWLLGFATLGFSTFLYIRRIDDEEKMMLETFGEAYKQYSQRTGRLLPKF